MNFSEIVGIIAGCLTTTAFLPQLIKILKDKSAKDVSLLMYIIFCSGIILWLIYGILINSFPIILFNSITFILNFLILLTIIKNNLSQKR
ncbi:MAG: hypothetical protein A2086_10475 [Spirochaetes bacterium GWD1_27_9]|nr:MAG: hypothetical protein A2Z98_08765 [Spirochaetes bacterium GWB1_27_13]OHD25416.1 MAG: hypothetical protein A2Y34_10900 [Spirochaetes bacterium GWC1_27_15]OHD29492.1 MAG: hypothetical protein A2086_10475 [Spirochaetes bacterium GWD1_27_9]